MADTLGRRHDQRSLNCTNSLSVLCYVVRNRYSQPSRELLRALRGPRSQVAFARKLGYRSNVPAQWESGRRTPPMMAVARAVAVAGRDWSGAFEAFHPQTAPLLRDEGLAAWLRAHKGRASHAAVARSCGLSAHQVGRILRGDSDPRLHDFLELLDTLTGRAADWVAALVPIEQVPSLAAAHRAKQAASRVIYERPWAAAVIVCLGAAPPEHAPAPRVAAALGLDEDEVRELIDVLLEVGLLRRTRRGLQTTGVSLDTPPTDQQIQGMRAHWGRVAADRLNAPGAHDRFHYTVCNVSQADLARIQALQADTYRQIRAIVAGSEQPEVAALVTLHALAWDPTDAAQRLPQTALEPWRS